MQSRKFNILATDYVTIFSIIQLEKHCTVCLDILTCLYILT